jgi:DNA invertase Pin-like site-specific DNA recombinase
MPSKISDKLSAKKAAIYIRVSTHWQIDKDSLKVQRRELTAYVEMVLGISDYVIFEDPGYSAKNTDRPDYQTMMERIRTGEFTHLVVWKIDRISRNLLDFASMYDELKKLGVTFVSKNEQFDTSNAIGEAMLKIILVFAELERQMTSERVTAVMLSRANNGQWNGGRVPYGYKWDKESGTFSIVDHEAKVIRRMAELYEQYQSLLYVAKYLNNAGISTKSGKQWTPTTVRTMLTNPWYIGHYVYNVHSGGKGTDKRSEDEWITVENHHEPILDERIFYRLKFLLQRNKRGGVPAGKTYVRKNVHIFGGMLRCAKCGSIMIANQDKRRANGIRPSIYACGSRRRKQTDCTNKYISDMTLGPFVLNYIANIIRAAKSYDGSISADALSKRLLRGEAFAGVASVNDDALSSLLSAFDQAADAPEYRPQLALSGPEVSITEVDTLKGKRQRLENALSRLNALYLYDDEAMPEKDFVMQRSDLTKQLGQVNARIEEIQAQDSGQGAVSDNFAMKASYYIMTEKLVEDSYIDYESYIRAIDPAVPKSFLASIIDHIDVDDGRVVSITFKNGAEHRFTYKD